MNIAGYHSGKYGWLVECWIYGNSYKSRMEDTLNIMVGIYGRHSYDYMAISMSVPAGGLNQRGCNVSQVRVPWCRYVLFLFISFMLKLVLNCPCHCQYGMIPELSPLLMCACLQNVEKRITVTHHEGCSRSRCEGQGQVITSHKHYEM